MRDRIGTTEKQQGVGWASKTRPTLLLLCVWTLMGAGEPPSVGYTGRIKELFLPGAELEPKPYLDRKTPIILRILKTEPVKDGFRYDLEYIGLEPGTFDLRDHLQRRDGSRPTDLPEVRVKVASILPPGQVLPNDLQPHATPRPGGYRLALIVGGIAWALVLAAILFVVAWNMSEVKHFTLILRRAPIADRVILVSTSPYGCSLIESSMAGGDFSTAGE